MKLRALCGAAGAGKDTVADMLPARKLAFADTLYAEVAAAWGVEQHVLRCRETKETPVHWLGLWACKDESFYGYCMRYRALGANRVTDDRSPRQILQWWADYRRAQDPDYFVKAVEADVANIEWHGKGTLPIVLTDVRFPNEAAMVRQLGGQIWQIKRPGYEAGGTGHASDNDGSQFNPDRIIYNNGTLEELRETVLKEWNQ